MPTMAVLWDVEAVQTAFVLFLTFIISSNGINLDARFSVIKRGEDRSYFGFSVAQHQILDGSKQVYESVLLIGAPKEIRKIEGKDSGGAIYRCDAKRQSESCQRIEEGVSFPILASELVDDQWLGVTVASQGAGKKAVACAHRYTKDNAALGVCYVYSQRLEYEDPFRPCENLPHNRFLQDFGLCQAGMSAVVGQDDALVMGAPGSVFWQGVMFLTNVTDEIGVTSTGIPSPYIDPKLAAADSQASPTKAYSYNGYAVAMGRFDRSQVLYYVSGAPKSHNKGEIVFFKEMPKGTLRYEGSHIVRGPMEFSGYGSSLMVADLNMDGYDDLIVGAPYYKRHHGGAFYVYLGGEKMISNTTVPTEILSRKMDDEECGQLMCEHARFGISLTKLGDINMDGFPDFAVGAPYEGKGAVYIYHGANNAIGFNKEYAQRITASDLPVPELMSFGYSLSGGMDLDENGYPDLLVGAYESDAVALIRSRPIIKIIPNLSVFPTAVDLEATPMCNHTDVKPEFRKRHCVAVKMCLSFTTKPADSIQVIPRVLYKLEAEPQRRVARVDLQDAMDASKKIIENKELTLSQSGEVCATEIALLKGEFDDKLNPMEFRFSFGLTTDSENPDQYPLSATQDINLFPVLDTEGAEQGSANSVSVEADFIKECGDDNKCISNLQFSANLKGIKKNASDIYEMVISQENEIEVEFIVSNEGEPAYLTRVYVQRPESVSYLGVESDDSVICQGLKGDETLHVCDSIGNPLRPDKTVYFTLKLKIPRFMAETGQLYNITAWVNTSSTELTPVNDIHVMKFHVINKAEIFLVTNIEPDKAILCQGEPRGASAMVNEIDIGASVKHNFIVRNAGPGVVSESYIQISWPYEVAVGPKGGAGKYLLYLMRKPKITGPVIQCNDDDIEPFINPLKIQEVSMSEDPPTGASTDTEVTVEGVESLPEADEGSRRKRDANIRRKRATGGVVVFSCDDGSAKCFDYKCKLGKLESASDYVKITMEARLWESTLLSDYRQAADVQIISWGKIEVPSRLKITQDTSDDKRRAITRAIPDFKETAGQTVQWWIILVAVLVGLLVLLVVIFILYKLGFFRRKRMEDMQMYKAEKKEQAMLQNEYDEDEGP